MSKVAKKVIRISKNIKDMNDTAFLKEAIKELQSESKTKGKTFVFDVEERTAKRLVKNGV